MNFTAYLEKALLTPVVHEVSMQMFLIIGLFFFAFIIYLVIYFISRVGNRRVYRK